MNAHRPRPLRRNARLSVVSALTFFVLFQLLIDWVVQRQRIELRDPEYGFKLPALKRGLGLYPDRPLLLILGSSRTEIGLIPSELHLVSPDGDKEPFVFNMAISGSGPILQLLCLKRILAEGIQPRWVMLEVLPAFLSEEFAWSDTAFLNMNRISYDELPVLCKYNSFPARLYSNWIKSHAVPWYTHRFLIMNHYAPLWLPQSVRSDYLRNVDGHGYRYGITPLLIDEGARQHALAHAEKQYAGILKRFNLSDSSDQALHDLLDLCHERHMPTLLYVMPEGERFRNWYPPTVQDAIRHYLDRVTAEYGATLVDARKWFHEADFADSHHLLGPGAWAFSKRFGSEVNQIGFLNNPSHSETHAAGAMRPSGTETSWSRPEPDSCGNPVK